jgi:hypothetical protein
MKLLTVPQGSQEWLQARAGVITASRFKDALAKVGGLDEKQQAYVDAVNRGMGEKAAYLEAGYKAQPKADVIKRALEGQDTSKPGADAMAYAWLIALETVAREPLDETFVTYAMRRGQELEPQAKRVYEHRTGRWIEDVSLILTDDERFGASCDGLIDDDGAVEVKVPFSPEKIGAVWEHPETAHVEYIDQIDGQLWITGRQWCDLIIYCPWLAPVGKDLFVKRIFRNEARIEALESGLVDFMRMVDRNLEILRTPMKLTGAKREKVDPVDGLTLSQQADAADAFDAQLAHDTPPWEPVEAMAPQKPLPLLEPSF